MGGGSLRTLGLLKVLSRAYPVKLLVLSKDSLSDDQKRELKRYVKSITRVPMVGGRLGDSLLILARMVIHCMPYHCAQLHLSFQRSPTVVEQLRSFGGVVYASFGHWGTLVRGQRAGNWILDQHNADVDFWRVYATQATGLGRKLAALVNWRLAAAHFPQIYESVGSVISVCEADRKLTQAIAPSAEVGVIENGVDCSYYVPDRATRSGPPRLLFTGTSAPRNVTALRRFARDVWPLVQRKVPRVELLVAGNFGQEAQMGFKAYTSLRFTGRVDDMRPYFNQSDVFIAPFEDTHGSKLKIAEAMAMAMPIVSTREGIRGFALVDEESVLLARDNEEFAAKTVALLRDVGRRQELGMAARRVALATIDWAVLGKRLHTLVRATGESLI